MKIVYTASALADLGEILSYLQRNYPTVIPSFEKRLRSLVTRIGDWPESAEAVAERPGVRGAPLIRYPYKVFYRVAGQTVEILHIYHTSRRRPWEEETEHADIDNGED
jgi:toxin ParE1/3/4